MKKQINTTNAPQSPAILSQAIESNSFIFVAGQIHNTPEGKLIEGSITDKLEQVMKNIRAILEETGVTFEDIIKVTIYVTDITVLKDLNAAYPTYFNKPYPAREAICVQALPLGASLEISVIAEKK